MALNVTTAVFRPGFNIATASPSLVQWDQGQMLQFEGVELPSAYQVEFTNAVTVQAITMIGNENGVEIPNELLQQSFPINAYIVLHETAEDRETEYWATIYVKARQKPREETPDPEQSSVIDQTIAALQEGVAEAQAAANEAEAASQAVQDMGVEAETLPEGSAATVEKTVDPETGVVTLTYGIPKGAKGDKGDKGNTGETYMLAPSVDTIVKNPNTGTFIPAQIIFTVYKVVNGTSSPYRAAAIVADIFGSGMVPHYEVVNDYRLTVPINSIADTGYVACTAYGNGGIIATITIPCILDGAKGDPGEGVAPGGTTGQFLKKKSGEDYDTEWADVDPGVTSVNGKTGAVTLTASDVGAKPASYEAPVSSVNEKTGAVVLDAGDIGYDGETTYPDASVGKELGMINSALNDLNDLVTDEAETWETLQPISSSDTQKVVYNTQYNRIILQNNQYTDCKVYEVIAGMTYEITAFGSGTAASTFAVVGDQNLIASGASYTALKQIIVPDQATDASHTVQVTIENSGYLYCNHQLIPAEVKVLSTSHVIKTDKTLKLNNVPADAYAVGIALSRNTIIKNGQSITFVKPSSTSGKSVGITLNRIGPNSLLDIDIVAFGDFANNTFTPATTVFDAYTDNIGPFSIGRNVSEGGSWAGGYHSKNVGGTACPTAEQTDFAVYVDGVDITNQNGVFFVDAVVKTKNSIYFPTTITGSDLTTATKAITENRRFSFGDGVLTVEVIAETVEETYISGYYGMQMQTNWATQFVFPMADAVKLNTEVTTGYSTTNKGHLLIAESSNAHAEMELCDDGIGTYKYNDDGHAKAFVMENGSKMYFYQMWNVTIPQGSYLFWKGRYRFEHC